jgi:undecaprenyl-diphosphatase
MTLLKAAVLGVIQGVLEFLPVSSTAHLILSERAIGFEDPGGIFTVMIQFGSVLAVMWLYRAKILEVVRGLPTQPAARRFALMLVAAFIPAAVAGALLAPFVKSVLYYSPGTIGTAFILGGVVMLIVERWRRAPTVRDIDSVPFTTAIGVGACQAVALVPGVSRSGATIVGGLVGGLERPTAAEFSFFLAMPTMAAAFAHDLLDARHHLAGDRMLEIAVGFVMAFVASAVVVRPFVGFVRRSGFGPFAWYRIVSGALVLAALAAGLL